MASRGMAGRRVWAPALGVLALLSLAWAGARWGAELWALLRDRPRLQTWLAGFGGWAPAVSIGLGALKPLLPFVPGQALALANGWLFGFWSGALYGLTGTLLGSGLVMLLARRWGRPLVGRLVGPARRARIDALAQRRGGPFFFLLLLLPLTPDDLACWAIGLTRLPLLRTFGLVAVARSPGVAVAAWLGAHAGRLSPAGWAVLAAAGAGAIAVYIWRRRSLEALVWRWLDKASLPASGPVSGSE